jgi:L-lactate dehydrogenase complex protein LldE
MSRHVALFVSCLNDQFYPRVGVAVVKVLEALGCSVGFPAGQTCCGQPMFNNGYQEEARVLARRWVEAFEGYDYVVTPSGSCCAMVREHFAELFKGDVAWEADAARVAAKTYEFAEFLTKVLRADFGDLTAGRRKYTYHYTCHLRGLGMTDEAVRLLRRMSGVEFVPLERSDQCCGFGGTFALKYPAISRAMVEDKVEQIRRSGADVAICNDAGCSMNIAGMCRKREVKTEVRHIAEVIAEAMGLDIEKF